MPVGVVGRLVGEQLQPGIIPKLLQVVAQPLVAGGLHTLFKKVDGGIQIAYRILLAIILCRDQRNFKS